VRARCRGRATRAAEETLKHLFVFVHWYAETGVVDVDFETLTFNVDAIATASPA